MKFKTSVITSVVLLTVFSCCCKKVANDSTSATMNSQECANACAKIIPSESATQITATDLENGKYYGSLNQKKKGTPENWIHILEGTRSASWCNPHTKKSFSSGCDCNKY